VSFYPFVDDRNKRELVMKTEESRRNALRVKEGRHRL
jgi:hypothetical protein